MLQSVIRLTISAPDTGLRVTPMIPPRNSLAVGGVATCTVASPQYQRSTRLCGGNLHDSAVALWRAPQVHSTCLRRERAPARSLVSRDYLHSSVPSVAAAYATLRRQSARFRCRSSANSPSLLHVSWARTSSGTDPRFQESARSCFLLAFYAKLSQASTRVWPVIDTSVRPPSRNEARRCGFSKTNRASIARPYLLKTNTIKTL